MSQSTAMDRLTKDLRQASDFRMTVTDEMRGATQSALAACTTIRGKTMHKYRTHAHKLLADLVKDVAAQRHDTARQIMLMAKRQKSSLEAGRRKLAAEVTKLRASVRRHQQGVRADLMKAHEIWSAFKLGGPAGGMTRKH